MSVTACQVLQKKWPDPRRHRQDVNCLCPCTLGRVSAARRWHRHHVCRTQSRSHDHPPLAAGVLVVGWAPPPSPTLPSSHRRSQCNGSAIHSTAEPTTPANNINNSDAVTAVASGPSPSLPTAMYRPYGPRNARDRVARRQRSGLALRSLQSRPYLSHHRMPDVDPLEVLDDPCGAHRPLRHVTSSCGVTLPRCTPPD